MRSNGIDIGYLTKVSGDDLKLLETLADRTKGKCEKFAAFIRAATTHERQRRASLADPSAEPIEATIVNFNGATLTGNELADALTVSHIAFRLAVDDGGVALKAFVCELNHTITSWAATRLRQS